MRKLALLLVSLLACAQVALATDNTRPQDVFDGMKESFRPDRAQGVNARFSFDLSGPMGGKWWIEVTNDQCHFGRGPIQNPSVTFLASDKDWVALSNGDLSGVWATVTGRLKIHGDRALARKLDQMFP